MKHQAIQGREWAAEYIDVTDPGITIETATVYRAAGRRWFTLEGAANAAAKERIRTALRESGDENTDIDWFSGAMNFISASFRDRFRKRR